ncbi:MAG: ABC transporter ATP-binding protein [Eubacteriales bacterium]|nr:ABC transporter ATP-binding protein [Eubacteriales bacterium]
MKENIKNIRKKEKNDQKIAFWKSIFIYLKEYRKNAFIAIFFSALTGVGVALQPLVIKYIIDEGITVRKSMAYVAVACAVYIMLALLRICAYRFSLFNMLKALEGTLFNMRSRFFMHVQHMCMRFHDKHSSGELYNSIMGSPMSNIKAYLNSIILGVPYQLVSLVISIVALVYYDWILTIIMLGTAFCMALLNFFSRKVIRRSSSEFISAETETGKYISDVFHGMDAIKMYSIEDSTQTKFYSYLQAMRDKGMAYTFSVHRENLKPELAHYLGTAVVYLVGAFSCIYRGLTVGILYAFLSSMGTILGVLTSWLNISLQKSAANVAMEKIEEIIRENSSTPELPDGKVKNIISERDRAYASGLNCIDFCNVKFSYESDGKTHYIFNGLSFSVKYKESIALVGSSGSGKSTVTKLLMRLYDIDGGKILLHGSNIREYPSHDLRYSIGIVPQSPFIFQGTIWDNVRITCPEADNDRIIKAMETARVNEFVSELPMGVNTRVGDGALGLSGGQKQRIAIARAILKNPDILIFDEATSALDNISERHIQEAMEDLMKTHTVIIIAHRLSTIRNVDRILVFDKGEIVENGSYKELAEKEGMFRELLKSAEE